MKPANPVQEFFETLTGDTIERIFRVVDETIKDLNYCYTCECLMPLPLGHPHCNSCKSPMMIQRCKGCGDWYCKTGCRQSHVCGSGENPYEFQA